MTDENRTLKDAFYGGNFRVGQGLLTRDKSTDSNDLTEAEFENIQTFEEICNATQTGEAFDEFVNSNQAKRDGFTGGVAWDTIFENDSFPDLIKEDNTFISEFIVGGANADGVTTRSIFDFENVDELTDSENGMEEVTDSERAMDGATESEVSMDKVTDKEVAIEVLSDKEFSFDFVLDNFDKENVEKFLSLDDTKLMAVGKFVQGGAFIDGTGVSSENVDNIDTLTDSNDRMEEVTDSERAMDGATESEVAMDKVTDKEMPMDKVTDKEIAMDKVTDKEVAMDKVTDKEMPMDKVTDKEIAMDSVMSKVMARSKFILSNELLNKLYTETPKVELFWERHENAQTQENFGSLPATVSTNHGDATVRLDSDSPSGTGADSLYIELGTDNFVENIEYVRKTYDLTDANNFIIDIKTTGDEEIVLWIDGTEQFQIGTSDNWQEEIVDVSGQSGEVVIEIGSNNNFNGEDVLFNNMRLE